MGGVTLSQQGIRLGAQLCARKCKRMRTNGGGGRGQQWLLLSGRKMRQAASICGAAAAEQVSNFSLKEELFNILQVRGSSQHTST